MKTIQKYKKNNLKPKKIKIFKNVKNGIATPNAWVLSPSLPLSFDLR
jgi:hypothetical protein